MNTTIKAQEEKYRKTCLNTTFLILSKKEKALKEALIKKYSYKDGEFEKINITEFQKFMKFYNLVFIKNIDKEQKFLHFSEEKIEKIQKYCISSFKSIIDYIYEENKKRNSEIKSIKIKTTLKSKKASIAKINIEKEQIEQTDNEFLYNQMVEYYKQRGTINIVNLYLIFDRRNRYSEFKNYLQKKIVDENISNIEKAALEEFKLVDNLLNNATDTFNNVEFTMKIVAEIIRYENLSDEEIREIFGYRNSIKKIYILKKRIIDSLLKSDEDAKQGEDNNDRGRI